MVIFHLFGEKPPLQKIRGPVKEKEKYRTVKLKTFRLTSGGLIRKLHFHGILRKTSFIHMQRTWWIRTVSFVAYISISFAVVDVVTNEALIKAASIAAIEFRFITAYNAIKHDTV